MHTRNRHEMFLFHWGVISPFGKKNEDVAELDLHFLPPSATQNPQTLSKTCVAWFMLIVKRKNHPEGALDCNTAQPSFKTTMYSGSEHRKTGQIFSYPSDF